MKKIIAFSLIAYALIISHSAHCMLARFISTRPSKKILNIRRCHSREQRLHILKEEKSLVYCHELKLRNELLLKLITEQNEAIKIQERSSTHNIAILNGQISPFDSIFKKELLNPIHYSRRIKDLEVSLVDCANNMSTLD